MINIKNLWPYECKNDKRFDDLEVGYAVAKLIRNQKEINQKLDKILELIFTKKML
jgi:hypothetical protein